MNRIKHVFSNLFKLSNVGMMAFFTLNLLVLIYLFEPMLQNDPNAMPTLFFLYVLSLLLSFSPLGQDMLCFFNGAKQISRVDVKEKILPLVQEVYAMAKNKTPEMPDRINIRIIHEAKPNAYAIGRNTICITEGLLSLPERNIRGIIAHEMGHLALQHTLLHTLIGGGNVIMTLIMLFAQICKYFSIIVAALGVLWGRKGAGILTTIFAGISAALFMLWTWLCKWLLRRSGRAHDFEADRYAYEIGFGSGLAEALDRYDLTGSEKHFLKVLEDNRSEKAERIGALQRLGVSYAGY